MIWQFFSCFRKCLFGNSVFVTFDKLKIVIKFLLKVFLTRFSIKLIKFTKPIFPSLEKYFAFVLALHKNSYWLIRLLVISIMWLNVSNFFIQLPPKIMIYIKNVSIKILVFYLICQVVFCINYHIHFGVIDIKIYFAILWILRLMKLIKQ